MMCFFMAYKVSFIFQHIFILSEQSSKVNIQTTIVKYFNLFTSNNYVLLNKKDMAKTNCNNFKKIL